MALFRIKALLKDIQLKFCCFLQYFSADTVMTIHHKDFLTSVKHP